MVLLREEFSQTQRQIWIELQTFQEMVASWFS